MSWRQDAIVFERYGADQLAKIARRHAEELDAAIRSADNEVISLATAEIESGYSADHLRRLIREGKLQNVGQKHRPRVRRGDLPRKAAKSRSTDAEAKYEAVTDARALLSRR